jgi:2-keto-4-pentenoate hydratase/2-oxohepta-3-ene-1,7-dioic acid hydratase in catechol pathway
VRFALYDHAGAPRPALIVDGRVFDAAQAARVAGEMTSLDLAALGDPMRYPGAAHGALDQLRRVQAALPGPASSETDLGPVDEHRLRAPVHRPTKILCVGLNYRDHIAEVGAQQPKRPHVFAKLPNALIGPTDDVVFPSGVSEQLDYEAELAIVIGRRAKRVSVAAADRYILGYTVANDVSGRDWQFDTDAQLTLGKGFDTFFPLGPWIVTADELGDVRSLRIRCWVNGEPRQDASTADMVFGPAEIVSILSSVCTLEPGDVIATGTPSGVGFGRTPPRFLRPGDEVRCEVERIGALTNRVVEPKEEVA